MKFFSDYSIMHKLNWRYICKLAPLTAAIMSTSMHAAFADNVNLSFTGAIISSTCNIDTSSQTQTIDLGRFSADSFPSVGSTSKFKPFNINLSNCSQGIAGSQVWFTGQADGSNPSLLALSDTGKGTIGALATGIAVELLDDDQNTIVINNTTSSIYPLYAGDNTLTFYVRYKSTASIVTSGDATAVMYFDMQYQ